MGVIRRDVYVLRDALKNPIACVQGSDAVPIIFTVRDYDIPEGAKVRVYVQKPSTKAIFNDISGSVSGNEITVNVAPQMVAEQGISQIQLEISNDAKTLITFTYPLDVKRRLIPMDSENGSDFLDEYIEIMEESTSKAKMAAENANDAASRAESIAGDLNAKLENGDFQGAKGEAATISIGTVTSSAPGAHAEVSNSGDSSQAVFNFVIPRGEQGPKGDPGSVDNLEQQSLNYTEPSDPGEGEESIPVPGSTLGVIAGWLMKKVKGIITTISDLSNSVDVLGNNLSEVKEISPTTELATGTTFTLDESYKNFNIILVRLVLSKTPTYNLSDTVYMPTQLITGAKNNILKTVHISDQHYAYIQCGFPSDTTFCSQYVNVTGAYKAYAAVYGVQRVQSRL